MIIQGRPAPLDLRTYTQGPTGPTRIAVLMPRVGLRLERRRAAYHTLRGQLTWRDWSWNVFHAGDTDVVVDPATAAMVMTGEVLDQPVRVELGVDIRRGFVALLCPMCRRGLAADGLLVARRTNVLEFGCTRCLAPPPGDEAPSPAEVRAALEAMARGTTGPASSDARRGAGRKGGGCR